MSEASNPYKHLQEAIPGYPFKYQVPNLGTYTYTVTTTTTKRLPKRYPSARGYGRTR